MVWIFLGVLLHISSSAAQQIITVYVSNESQLLQWLCHPSQLLQDNYWVQLTSKNYILFQESRFCHIESVANLTIQGATGGSSLQCINKGGESSAMGFGFTNITNLVILDLNVNGCGSTVTSEAIRLFNDSHPHLGVDQKAVFVLNHCTNITLKNVKVQYYLGYGLVMLNVRGKLSARTIEIHFASLANGCNNSDTFECSGSGVIIVFKDTVVTKAKEFAKIIVFDLNMSIGINAIYNIPNLWDMPSNDVCQLPLIGAAGLTVVFVQSYPASLSVIGTKNEMNIGSIASAMMVLFFNGMSNSHVYMANGNFSNDLLMPVVTNQVTGSGIILYSFVCNKCPAKVSGLMNTPLHIQGINLTDLILGSTGPVANHVYGGALLIKIHEICYNSKSMNILAQNTYFNLNYAATSGSSVYAVIPSNISRYLSIVFEDTKVWNNFLGMTQKIVYSSGASMTFINWNNVTIQGTKNVFHDTYLTAITGYNTILNLKGQMSFINSVSKVGAAISLHKSSYLVLHEPLTAIFSGNHAYLYGGAIYANNDDVLGDNRCVIQVKPQNMVSIKKFSINLIFYWNEAELAGNSIYANPIYNCSYLYGKSSNEPTSNYTVMDRMNIIVAEQSNALHNISSNPVAICMCMPHQNYICEKHKYINAFPGESLLLNLVALDGGNNIVYSPATATLTSISNHNNTMTQTKLMLKDSQSIVVLWGHKCTPVTYSILSNEDRHHYALLNLATPGNPPLWSVQITIHPCPTGFRLINGGCDCDDFINHVITGAQCNITSNSITISSGQWIGHFTLNNVSGLAFSSVCPQQNCKTDISSINMSSPNALCDFSKVGILCGQCRRELSAVFGSEGCTVCSNMWLLTILAYLVIGIVVVSLLLILDITIAQGYLASIIVSANVISVSIIDFLQKDGWFVTGTRVFVSLLNLNIGFPLCFYNGMTMTVKTGLQFAFPIYMWLLIIGFIQLSRHSTRVANRTAASSIQVLATLIHMSFAKLLVTSFDIFAYASVDTSLNSTVTVWYIDGNVVYFGDVGHIVLFCIAIVTMSLIIIPYIMVVTFGAQCLRWRLVNKFRPFIEAFHGPYKEGKGYWFGVRVASVVYVYIIFAVLRGHDTNMTILLQLVGLTVLTSIQTWIRPFKSTLVTVVDSICLTMTMVQLAVSLSYNTAIVLSILQVPLMIIFIGTISSSCWRRLNYIQYRPLFCNV